MMHVPMQVHCPTLPLKPRTLRTFLSFVTMSELAYISRTKVQILCMFPRVKCNWQCHFEITKSKVSATKPHKSQVGNAPTLD